MEIIRDHAARARERLVRVLCCWICCIILITTLLLFLLLVSLSGPGPGRYTLPPTVGYVNHDCTKPSSPAYSFHSRMSSASENVSKYFVFSGIISVWNSVHLTGLWRPRCDFCSGLCRLQPRTKVQHQCKDDPIWPDGNSFLLHSGQSKVQT